MAKKCNMKRLAFFTGHVMCGAFTHIYHTKTPFMRLIYQSHGSHGYVTHSGMTSWPQKSYSGRDSGRWRWKTKSRATPWSRELFTNELKSFWGTLPNPEDGAISRIIWVSYQCEVRGLISMFSIQPVFVSPLFLCPVSSLQCMQKRIFTAPDGIRYPESFVALPWFFCDHRWIRIYSLNQSIWVTLHVEPGHCEEISRPKTFDSEACHNIWLKVSPLSST